MRNEIGKKMFRVVCYIRIDLEDVQDPLTQQEALLEKEHLDLLHPDDLHVIEEIEDQGR